MAREVLRRRIEAGKPLLNAGEQLILECCSDAGQIARSKEKYRAGLTLRVPVPVLQRRIAERDQRRQPFHIIHTQRAACERYANIWGARRAAAIKIYECL